MQGSYIKALDHYKQSLAIQKELENLQGVAANLSNIAQIYSAQGDYSKALEYDEQSLAIDQEIGDQAGIAYDLESIGKYVLR